MSGLPPPYPGFSPQGSVVGTPPHSSFHHLGTPKPSPSHPSQIPGAGQMVGPGASPMHSDDKERLRFQIELEFVQCLGNPNYLNFLAQRGYFKDPTFINYLKYLTYWKEPNYVKFIKFPVCLHFLDLLQHEAFRKETVNAQCAKFLDDQTILHWQHYTRKRVKLIESANATNQQTIQGTPASQGSSHK